jgi:inosine-uridine nucleoside N-ribohydrolase
LSRKVILDADPGIDDAIAIVTALGSDEIEVVGIATVYGNVVPRIGVLNTLKVLNSMDRMDIPVIPGADRPLKKNLLSSKVKRRKERSHGKWGLGSLHVTPTIINESLKRKISSKKDKLLGDFKNKKYLEFIDEIIDHYSDGELSVIATGPLTNIAKAVLYRPEFAGKIGQLLIMGGAYSLGSHINGNITNFAEFNFYCDPDAAELVFTSPNLNPKIKVVGLDVTQHPDCGLDRKFVDKVRHRIKIRESSLSELILSLLDFKLIHKTIFHLHDVLAVLLCERPSYFNFKRGGIDITLSGKLRGHSEFIDDDMGKVQVANDVDHHQFKRFLYNRLVSY